ncbi:MAG: tetratricopeptide repeat protein, partial [Candidatus Thorarchaeota archaeon]
MVIIEKAELIHIKELILRGQYNDALIILKSIKNWERKLTTEEKETIQILLSIALMKLGDYKRSMKVARQIFSRAQKNQDIVLSLEAIIIISKIMNIHEKIDEGLVWVEKGEEYARQLIEQKKEEMNLLLAQYFMVKGIFLCKSSNFVDSWVHFSQALTLTENFKINDVKADVLNYVAYHYFSRGKMDLALEANHQSLEIWEKIENKFAIAEIKNDLAEILIIQGDIHLALEIFQEGIEIALLNSDKRLIAKYQFNIGLVYEQKHDFEKALDWHLRSMNSFQETDNNRKISKVFYHIISTQVNLGKLEEAENYFRQFTKLDESTNDELIHQWFLLSMALLYTYKSNFMNLGKVEEIYSELINQKEYDKQITIYVLLNLSKLQLDYLMKIENKGLLIDLERNLAKLEEIADMEDSFSLFIEVYLLQAQVAVLNENMQKAQELLTQARSLAQIKELDNLGTETSNVYNVLATKVEIWEKLLRFNSS